MKYVLALLGLLLSGAAQAQDAMVVATCGTLPQAYAAGSTRLPTVDTTGKLCGTGGGGAGNPGGSNTQLQYNNGGSFGGITGATSNGTSVTLTSPTFVTPALGTPASGVLTNATGYAIANLTGGGTGVLAALAINIGSAGAPVLFNGALGTPSSGTLTSATGLPVSTGLTGAGTGVLTALGVNVGSAGAFVTFNGALGTPSSGTLTNATGYAIANLTGGGTGVLAALAAAMNSSTGPIGALTPTNNNCVVGNGSAWTSAACSAGAGTVTSITPGGGVVSGVTASCTQTAITGSGTLSAAECLNAQTGTSYAIVDGDRGKLVTGTNAAAQAYSIAQAGAASAFANGWYTTVVNKGVGTLTITPTTSTINGAAAYALFAGQSVRIVSDGTNYQIDTGTNGGVTVSSQTGANYAFVASDFGKLINLSNGSNQIPTIAVASALGANWFVQACNQGAGTQTITPTTSTIGGAATFVLPAGSAAAPQCVAIVSDGTNYQVYPAFFRFGANVATAAGVALSAAGGLSTTVASGTSALGTGAITSATCATAVTTSATNTATTDVIWWGFNGDPTAVTGYVPLTSGMLTIIAYPSANNVNFKVCNNTTASITPGAITLNWRVIR